MSSALDLPLRGPTRCRPRWWGRVVALAVSLLWLAALGLWSSSAAARWPPAPESDGVYGRLRGDTDASLKLGGLISHSQISASVGASAHYYSLLGITGDYSESLDADAVQLRSFSLGIELRPLFLPRWLLGKEHGPAWLDLTLDSMCVGFGAYFSRAAAPFEHSRGVWMSLGVGIPVLGRANGPWLEVRQLRRWPDREMNSPEAHNALLLYLSWHELVQLGSTY
ncbi:MAG: hypothetical protein ABI895_34105 [Deltaproteobacteria bacterium]